ncbi:MAG: PAS domain-containing protein [bacterium]|nr:PAS domain-containing protein [bacterium]
MTLARAFGLYLLLLHLAVAVVGAYLLWPDHRPWILLLELGLLASLIVAGLLLRRLKMPREMVDIGTEWVREGDFGHSFRPTGAVDVDRLTRLCNEMFARLRSEHVRQEEKDIFLHKVLVASPSGIITTDYEGRVEEVSPAAAKLLALSPEELCGHRPSELASPLVRRLAEVPVGESRLLGQPGGRRLKCIHSQFFDRGFPRSFFVIEDLTHELWASEKLAYRALIRTLSHEVNNTLGATNSILHSALAYRDQLRSDDRDDFTEALRVAIERTDHLGAFMRRYAEVVRLPQPVKRPADVGEVLRRIVRLMHPECRRRAVEVSLTVEPGRGPIAMDEIQMEQVFVNVLRNALEAIDRDGAIDIRVGVHSGRATVVIEDSGPGLDAEAQANLFTPFFSTKPQGQGVGLTLVREILTLHDFDFALESPPGGPTRFLIMFDGGT